MKERAMPVKKGQTCRIRIIREKIMKEMNPRVEIGLEKIRA